MNNVTTGNDDWGKWNRDRVTANFAYAPSAQDKLSMQVKFHRNHQGGSYVQGAEPFDYEIFEDIDQHNITTNVQWGGSYEHKFSADYKTLLLMNYSRSFQDVIQDADGTSANTAGQRDEDHRDYFFSLENRFLYKGTRWENLLGWHAHKFNLKDDYAFNLLFPVGGGVSTPLYVDQFVDRSRQTLAVFDSLTYKFNDRHRLNLGLRGEYVDSEYGTDIFAQRLEDLGAANSVIDNYISDIDGPYAGKNSQFVVLPKLSYQYLVGAHHWGVEYTRGYRTSGVSINRRRAIAVEYDPEYTNNYELSYKFAKSEQPQWQIGANLFYIDWRDQQVQVQLSNDFYDTQVANAARSEVYGAEIEGQSHWGEAHKIYLGLGYVKTRFKDFISDGEDLKDHEFPFAAQWTARLTHEWTILKDTILFTSARALDDSYTSVKNDRKSEGPILLDMNLRYIWDQWVFGAYVNNLLDSEFLIFDGTPAGNSNAYQTSYHYINTPREFGLRLSYYW